MVQTLTVLKILENFEENTRKHVESQLFQFDQFSLVRAGSERAAAPGHLQSLTELIQDGTVQVFSTCAC